jgi:hypothetical protein
MLRLPLIFVSIYVYFLSAESIATSADCRRSLREQPLTVITQIYNPFEMDARGFLWPQNNQVEIRVTDESGRVVRNDRTYYSYRGTDHMFRSRFVDVHLSALNQMYDKLNDDIPEDTKLFVKQVELELPVARQAMIAVLGEEDGLVKGLARIFDATNYRKNFPIEDFGGAAKFLVPHEAPFLKLMKKRQIEVRAIEQVLDRGETFNFELGKYLLGGARNEKRRAKKLIWSWIAKEYVQKFAGATYFGHVLTDKNRKAFVTGLGFTPVPEEEISGKSDSMLPEGEFLLRGSDSTLDKRGADFLK